MKEIMHNKAETADDNTTADKANTITDIPVGNATCAAPALRENQQAIIRTYLGYRCLSNMFFISAVWLYFYRLFITDAQIGILDGLAFAIGLVAEVPSGVLADRFGRGRITRLGVILTGLGFLIQAFSSSFLLFFMGQSIMMIGVSFTSGAEEALFFSKINFDQNSAQWRKLVTRGSQVALLGTLAAIIIGGWLHTLNPRLPWFLTGLSFFGAALLIWRVNDAENVQKSSESAKSGPRKLSVPQELKNHVQEIWIGFLQFRRQELFCYLPLILTVQALFYATGWGLLRIILLDRFHFDPMAGSVVVALCNILTVGALSILHHHAEKITEKQMLTSIAISAATSLLIAIPDIGLWGFASIFALYAGERILYPFLSEILNKSAPEEQRATILSIASFFKVLPYIFLAPLIGALNTQGTLAIFLFLWPCLIAAALAFYLFQKKKFSVSPT